MRGRRLIALLSLIVLGAAGCRASDDASDAGRPADATHDAEADATRDAAPEDAARPDAASPDARAPDATPVDLFEAWPADEVTPACIFVDGECVPPDPEAIVRLAEAEPDAVWPVLAGLRSECRAATRSARQAIVLAGAARVRGERRAVDGRRLVRRLIGCARYGRAADLLVEAMPSVVAAANDEWMRPAAGYLAERLEWLYEAGLQTELAFVGGGADDIDIVRDRDVQAYLACADRTCRRVHLQRIGRALAVLSMRQAYVFGMSWVHALRRTQEALSPQSVELFIWQTAPITLLVCDASKRGNLDGACLSFVREHAELLARPEADNPLSAEICLFQVANGQLGCLNTGSVPCADQATVIRAISGQDRLIGEGTCEYAQMFSDGCFGDDSPPRAICQVDVCLEDETAVWGPQDPAGEPFGRGMAPMDQVDECNAADSAGAAREAVNSFPGRDCLVPDAAAARGDSPVRRCIVALAESRAQNFEDLAVQVPDAVTSNGCDPLSDGEAQAETDKREGAENDAVAEYGGAGECSENDMSQACANRRAFEDAYRAVLSAFGWDDSDGERERDVFFNWRGYEQAIRDADYRDFGENPPPGMTLTADTPPETVRSYTDGETIYINTGHAKNQTREGLAEALEHEGLHVATVGLDCNAFGGGFDGDFCGVSDDSRLDHMAGCALNGEQGNCEGICRGLSMAQCSDVMDVYFNAANAIQRSRGRYCAPDQDCMDDCSISGAAHPEARAACLGMDQMGQPPVRQPPIVNWIRPNPEAFPPDHMDRCTSNGDDPLVQACADTSCPEDTTPGLCRSGQACCCRANAERRPPSAGCAAAIECPPEAALVQAGAMCRCEYPDEGIFAGPQPPNPRPE